VASGSPIKQFSAKHTDQKFYVNDVNVSFRAKGENEPIRRITEVNQWDYNFEKQNYLAELIPSSYRGDLRVLFPPSIQSGEVYYPGYVLTDDIIDIVKFAWGLAGWQA